MQSVLPTTPTACGETGSSVKKSENWSHPIPSIGLGRQTTTPQDSFPEFTIIFPLLLPAITLDLPEFTFSPLLRRLTLQSATRLPGYFIVGAIRTKSDAYSNSEGRPLLDSLGTTANSSGLITDPYWKLTFTLNHLHILKGGSTLFFKTFKMKYRVLISILKY